MKTKLDELREQLDHIDHELLALLEKRIRVVKKVAAYKLENNLPLLDPKRKKAMMDNRIMKAEDLDIPVEFSRKLFELIHDLSLSKEEELKK